MKDITHISAHLKFMRALSILITGMLVIGLSEPGHATNVTITFDANYQGASPATSTQTETGGNTAALNANSFSRTGHYFVEWNTNANGSGDAIKNQASVTFAANDTLYAQWLPVSTLKFNDGKKNGSGTREYQFVTGSDNGYGWDDPEPFPTFIDYYNVTVDNVGPVDAKVTYVRHFSSVEDADPNPPVANRIDTMDNDAEFNDGEKNEWIQAHPDFNRDVTGQDPYIEIKIEFFRGLLANTNTTDRVTVGSFDLSIYDVDNDQFVSIPGSSSVFLAPNTHLVQSVETIDGLNYIRVQAPSANTAGNTGTSYNVGRVTYRMPALNTMTVRLGVKPKSGDIRDSANFSLDFSLNGLSWGNNVTPVEQSAAAIVAAATTPRSVPYEGPLNLRNQSGALCSNGEGVLTGERLNTITEIYVGDKKVAQELLSDGRLKYSLKDIAPGTYQIRYWVPVNNVNLTDQIRVGTCSTTPVATAPGAFEASRLFANYRGDRGPVIARDRAAITAFINQYKGITSVRCVGSTSGVPAKQTDPALAQARAKNACDIVKTLVPNATFTLETSTGKGVGQRFRSVTIFISGTN